MENIMRSSLKASDVTIGFHTEGYRIDQTATPMNRYTRWEITQAGQWSNPKPVCFDSMPQSGWTEVDKFDWD